MQAAVFPSGSDIPDNPDSVALGVINYEWFTQGSAVLQPALSGFYQNGPGGGGQSPRQYKNNFAVLVADPDRNRDMERHARRCLAAQNIKDHPPESLQPYQRESLDAELTNAEKDLYLAIQRLYVNLYYPSTDHPISNDTLMHHVLISPEVATEKPGDGQHAVIQTLASRRKLITPDTADLDPESYWKRRPNLLGGKVALSALREEFTRVPGNYMLLNGGVADALLRNALDREVIVIQTGVGQIITEGRELVKTDDAQAVVYLRDNACPDCFHYQDDCRCGEKKPQLCPLCSKEQHPGPCETAPPAPTLFGAPPPFKSGLEPQPMNVLNAELRRHMEQHNLTISDVANVTLGGGDAEFVNFLGTVIGQGLKALVSYDLRRGHDLVLTVKGMDLGEWSGTLARIAPALERMQEASVREANMSLPGDGNEPEQLERLLNQLPASHTAGMEVTFRPKGKEQPNA